MLGDWLEVDALHSIRLREVCCRLAGWWTSWVRRLRKSAGRLGDWETGRLRKMRIFEFSGFCINFLI